MSYYNIPTNEPFSSTFTVSTSQSSGGTVLEGFESSLGAWKQPSAIALTYGTDTSVSSFTIATRPYDGFGSGDLRYRFDSTKALCVVENSQGFDISSS
ncbi:MAG: hypothetical protein M1339_03165, partial [Bacteroidetes bacterium]|nr:hypothetical protein [Bacteroidota bacterium]